MFPNAQPSIPVGSRHPPAPAWKLHHCEGNDVRLTKLRINYSWWNLALAAVIKAFTLRTKWSLWSPSPAGSSTHLLLWWDWFSSGHHQEHLQNPLGVSATQWACFALCLHLQESPQRWPCCLASATPSFSWLTSKQIFHTLQPVALSPPQPSQSPVAQAQQVLRSPTQPAVRILPRWAPWEPRALSQSFPWPPGFSLCARCHHLRLILLKFSPRCLPAPRSRLPPLCLPRYTTGSSLTGPGQTLLLISHPTAPPLGRKCTQFWFFFFLHFSALVSILVLFPSVKFTGPTFSSVPPFPACFYSVPCPSPSSDPISPHFSLESNLTLGVLETVCFNRYIPFHTGLIHLLPSSPRDNFSHCKLNRERQVKSQRNRFIFQCSQWKAPAKVHFTAHI